MSGFVRKTLIDTPKGMSRIVMIIFVLGLTATSCRKSDRDLDNSLVAMEDQVVADQLLFDLFVMTDEAAKKAFNQIPFYTADRLDCANVNWNISGSPATVSIDFGSGCTSPDGRLRSGSILLQVNGTYGDSGVTTLVQLSGYQVDDFRISGSWTYQFMGTDPSSGGKIIDVSFNDVTFTDPASKTLTYSAERQWINVDGFQTFEVIDDLYTTTGTSSATARTGNPFDCSITGTLSQAVNCRYIISGTMELSPVNHATRYMDFGTECDSNTVVTINATAYYLAQD
mgnify:CR=1 FL=1